MAAETKKRKWFHPQWTTPPHCQECLQPAGLLQSRSHLELSWNTGPHSWCWDVLGSKCHMRMLVCQGDAAWLVLGPWRGHQTSWQEPGNLLHAARLHLPTNSRVYRCLLPSAGKIPPAPRNSTHLSFSLLTFQCPVTAPW